MPYSKENLMSMYPSQGKRCEMVKMTDGSVKKVCWNPSTQIDRNAGINILPGFKKSFSNVESRINTNNVAVGNKALPNTLEVTNLPTFGDNSSELMTLQENQLSQLFKPYGSFRLDAFDIRNTSNGQFEGMAYLTFKDEEGAKEALISLNRTEFKGKLLNIRNKVTRSEINAMKRRSKKDAAKELEKIRLEILKVRREQEERPNTATQVSTTEARIERLRTAINSVVESRIEAEVERRVKAEERRLAAVMESRMEAKVSALEVGLKALISAPVVPVTVKSEINEIEKPGETIVKPTNNSNVANTKIIIDEPPRVIPSRPNQPNSNTGKPKGPKRPNSNTGKPKETEEPKQPNTGKPKGPKQPKQPNTGTPKGPKQPNSNTGKPKEPKQPNTGKPTTKEPNRPVTSTTKIGPKRPKPPTTNVGPNRPVKPTKVGPKRPKPPTTKVGPNRPIKPTKVRPKRPKPPKPTKVGSKRPKPPTRPPKKITKPKKITPPKKTKKKKSSTKKN